jgi:hypothetical protein
LATLSADCWHAILDCFQDANVFQTCAFCTAHARSERIEHLLVFRGAEIVAAAQIRLVPVPLMHNAIAYVLWGPLFHRHKAEKDWTSLTQALNILRHEYVVKRATCLRIKPRTTLAEDTGWRNALSTEGFRRSTNDVVRRTILMDITRPLDDIRAGLDRKWRNCLTAAEKSSLKTDEGCDDAIFEVFLAMYREMLSRKHLAEPGDIRRFKTMQAILPPRHKLKVFVVRDQTDHPCAGAICSAIGERGLFLFGATADQGMKNKASYLVQWRIIQWLKETGCVEYDLHGSNADLNPGVYAFKMGLCGKNGREVTALETFDGYEGITNGLILSMADSVRRLMMQVKQLFGKDRDV